jgi:hypothetical protein
MDSDVIEASLPNGAIVLVQARRVDGDGATKTRMGRFDFQGVANALEGVADAIHGAVAKATPSKVSVELGLELAVKSGALVGMVVDGQATASLTVTLQWERTQEATEAGD